MPDFSTILGIVLTGISSTTFVTNAMAGLMLRTLRSYRPGDFIRTGDQFGRVTERGLFHTEIQTEDRDLATIPNLYLAKEHRDGIKAAIAQREDRIKTITGTLTKDDPPTA